MIWNEFTFNVAQYLFAMFCFHPASTISTRHPMLCCEISTSISTLSTQHPDEIQGSDISLSGACHDFIPRILQSTYKSSRYTRLQQWKASLRQLTGMSWIVTFRAPPWLMLGRIPPSITVWGVKLGATEVCALRVLLLYMEFLQCYIWFQKKRFFFNLQQGNTIRMYSIIYQNKIIKFQRVFNTPFHIHFTDIPTSAVFCGWPPGLALGLAAVVMFVVDIVFMALLWRFVYMAKMIMPIWIITIFDGLWHGIYYYGGLRIPVSCKSFWEDNASFVRSREQYLTLIDPDLSNQKERFSDLRMIIFVDWM